VGRRPDLVRFAPQVPVTPATVTVPQIERVVKFLDVMQVATTHEIAEWLEAPVTRSFRQVLRNLSLNDVIERVEMDGSHWRLTPQMRSEWESMK
jgi:disulfide oxidoreductase YuzD